MSLYRRIGDAVRRPSSILFQAGKLVDRAARTLWRRRWGLGGAAAFAVVAPLVFALLAPGETVSWMLVGLSGLFALALTVVFVLRILAERGQQA